MFKILRHPHQNYVLNSKIGICKKQLGLSDDDIYVNIRISHKMYDKHKYDYLNNEGEKNA